MIKEKAYKINYDNLEQWKTMKIMSLLLFLAKIEIT